LSLIFTNKTAQICAKGCKGGWKID
jgi:hypothetical protein